MEGRLGLERTIRTKPGRAYAAAGGAAVPRVKPGCFKRASLGAAFK